MTIYVTRIAKYRWAARCGDRYAEGHTEAEAIANLDARLRLTV